MNVTREDLDRFHDFAVSVVSERQPDLTWLQLFELWRRQDSSVNMHREDVAAIHEALQAMDSGRMRSLSAFDFDFRERHRIAEIS